jgi:hypothetical protein
MKQQQGFTVTSRLYVLDENGTDVIIADNNDHLNENGRRLLGNEVEVSLRYDQINVTIHQLNKTYEFTAEAEGGHEFLSRKNVTVTVGEKGV